MSYGSCLRLRAIRKRHVGSYDFVQDRAYEDKTFRILRMIDEFTRECLVMRVERRLNSRNVLDELREVIVRRGLTENIRSDNGRGFIANSLWKWLTRLGTKALHIELGSPRQRQNRKGSGRASPRRWGNVRASTGN